MLRNAVRTFGGPQTSKCPDTTLHEAIFKGFDGERVIGPARVYLKPYWKERGVSYFEEEDG